MKDIQNQPDFRNIPIDKVGIKGLKYPVIVRDKAKGSQSTVAEINMYVNLPHQCKGTHMSRFVELLHTVNTPVSLDSLTSILEDMKASLGAKSAHIEISFPYFTSISSLAFSQANFIAQSWSHFCILNITVVIIPFQYSYGSNR